MTSAAYLTEMQIIRRLELPEKVGRIAMVGWKRQGFPKPVDEVAGRYFWPEVEQWFLARHGVSTTTSAVSAPIPLPGNKGETFDEWSAALAASETAERE
jgi:hypothetical protein